MGVNLTPGNVAFGMLSCTLKPTRKFVFRLQVHPVVLQIRVETDEVNAALVVPASESVVDTMYGTMLRQQIR